MDKHHAHEGAEAHDHDHVHPESVPRPLDPTNVIHTDGTAPAPHESPAQPMPQNEVVTAESLQFMAREVVGGMLAVADAQGRDRTDHLADIMVSLIMRLAGAESTIKVLQTQLQVMVNENHDLHKQIDDCGCSDADPAVSTTNGDHP